VSGLGAKTYQQAAGFLRIHGGSHELDATAVHPESYAAVDKLLRDFGRPTAKSAQGRCPGSLRERLPIDDLLARVPEVRTPFAA
jgi:transcriptional accessory protein Tex/SPT6